MDSLVLRTVQANAITRGERKVGLEKRQMLPRNNYYFFIYLNSNQLSIPSPLSIYLPCAVCFPHAAINHVPPTHFQRQVPYQAPQL